MQVTLDEVAIGQFQRGGADNTRHHVGRVREKPLIVRAHGRAVSDHEGSLTGATGPAAALRVVGRSGRNVAQVNGAE